MIQNGYTSGYRLHIWTDGADAQTEVLERITGVATMRGLFVEVHREGPLPPPSHDRNLGVTIALPRHRTLVDDAAAITFSLGDYARDGVIPGDRHIAHGVHWAYALSHDPGHPVTVVEAAQRTVPRDYLDPRVLNPQLPCTPLLDLTVLVRTALHLPVDGAVIGELDRQDRAHDGAARARVAALQGLPRLAVAARDGLMAGIQSSDRETRARAFGGLAIAALVDRGAFGALGYTRLFARDASDGQRRAFADLLRQIGRTRGAVQVPPALLGQLTEVLSGPAVMGPRDAAQTVADLG